MPLFTAAKDNSSFLSIFNYCYPALIYFLYAFIKLLIGLYRKENIYKILLKFCGILLWTYGLQLLCKKGYTSVSWAIVLLPLAIYFTVM